MPELTRKRKITFGDGRRGLRGPLIYGSDYPRYEAGLALTHHLLERMQIPADEELVNRLTFEQID